jgi:uncharacterized phage infection (PIP) family protein YhgE
VQTKLGNLSSLKSNDNTIKSLCKLNHLCQINKKTAIDDPNVKHMLNKINNQLTQTISEDFLKKMSSDSQLVPTLNAVINNMSRDLKSEFKTMLSAHLKTIKGYESELKQLESLLL